MELTDEQRKTYHGLICPYCKVPSDLRLQKIYSVSYSRQEYIRICPKCGAYVGCHRGTQIAKGRLANPNLRQLKIQAHFYFDQIWRNKAMGRKEAYSWLAEKLSLPVEFTHIGWFNDQTCKDVIYYSKQFLNDLRRLDMDCGLEPKTPYYEN